MPTMTTLSRVALTACLSVAVAVALEPTSRAVGSSPQQATAPPHKYGALRTERFTDKECGSPAADGGYWSSLNYCEQNSAMTFNVNFCNNSGTTYSQGLGYSDQHCTAGRPRVVTVETGKCLPNPQPSSCADPTRCFIKYTCERSMPRRYRCLASNGVCFLDPNTSHTGGSYAECAASCKRMPNQGSYKCIVNGTHGGQCVPDQPNGTTLETCEGCVGPSGPGPCCP